MASFSFLGVGFGPRWLHTESTDICGRALSARQTEKLQIANETKEKRREKWVEETKRRVKLRENVERNIKGADGNWKRK